MKKAKTILFIGNNYCSTIEDLRSTFESNNKSNYIGKEGKPLRKELLAYFKDGLLSSWLMEHGYGKIAKLLPVWKLNDEISDNELFKAIYKVIFGQECTAILDSAFSNMAVLLRCEVDGQFVSIESNRISIIAKDAKELVFTFKAIEEIESLMHFEVVQCKTKKKVWKIKSEKKWCPSGSEFSITFNMTQLGKNHEGVFLLVYKGDKEDVVCEIGSFNNQKKEIVLTGGQSLTLYHFRNKDNAKNVEFWVTEPNIHTKLGIFPNRHDDSEVIKAELILKQLNVLAMPNYCFRFANKKEIDTLISQQEYDFYPSGEYEYYPLDDGKFTWLYNGKTKTVDPISTTFVAVLKGKKSEF